MNICAVSTKGMMIAPIAIVFLLVIVLVVVVIVGLVMAAARKKSVDQPADVGSQPPRVDNSEERKKILDMLEESKIDADEAERLLAALNET